MAFLKSKKGNLLPPILYGLSTAIIVLFIVIFAYNIYLHILQPSIYKPFTKIYENHKTKLGKPKGEAVKDNNPYEAAHEHATVLRIEKLNAFFLLDPRTSTWRK